MPIKRYEHEPQSHPMRKAYEHDSQPIRTRYQRQPEPQRTPQRTPQRSPQRQNTDTYNDFMGNIHDRSFYELERNAYDDQFFKTESKPMKKEKEMYENIMRNDNFFKTERKPMKKENSMYENTMRNDYNSKYYPVEKIDNSEVSVESREIVDETEDLKTIFDGNNSPFDFDFEVEKFPSFEVQKEDVEEMKEFNPPSEVESFSSPMKTTDQYSFLNDKMPNIDTSAFKNEEKKVQRMVIEPIETKERDVFNNNYPTFTNFRTIEKTKAEKPEQTENKERQKEFVKPIKPAFTHFSKSQSESLSKKPSPTKKPSFPSFTNFKSSNLKNKSSFSSLSSPKKTTLPKSTYPSFTNFKAQNVITSKSPSVNNYPSFTNFKAIPSKVTQPEAPKVQTASTPAMEYQDKTFMKTYEAPVTPSVNTDVFKNNPKRNIVTETPSAPILIPTKKPVTKKPYNYEKKNFREPLQQVHKNSAPHQIIRIKTPAKNGDMRPKPKQLSLNVPSQYANSGFKPIIENINPATNNKFPSQPTPGKLLIHEVTRRQGVIQPDEIVYDNQQPLITIDSVKNNNSAGPFRAQSQADSYAAVVQASFKPNLEKEKKNQRFQRRLIRLPAQKRNLNLNKTPAEQNVLTPKFESIRIRRARRLPSQN